jgi:arylsulfatase
VQLNGEAAELPDDPRWYSTIAYTDFAIDTVRHEALDQGRPFFLYLAYHAPHWPLHALPEDIDKYRGRYDAGTNAMRRARYRRMVERGLVDPTTCKLSSPEADVPRWNELTPIDQRRMSLKLAIHAAMVDRMDREIGRLVSFLKESSQLDNTVIFFLSDNGACAEGGPLGDGYEQKLNLHGELGTTESFPALGALGAGAVNTPLRKYKSTLYGGGCRTPLIAYWPARVDKPGRLVRDVAHAFDLMPTCLEAAGIEYPAEFRGKALHPLDGISLLPVLSGKPLPERALYWSFKHLRAVRDSRWAAIGQAQVAGRSQKPWELYDAAADQSETANIAGTHPGIVRALSGKWEAWNADTGALAGYQAYVERKRAKASNDGAAVP